jgi:hypothetical protein
MIRFVADTAIEPAKEKEPAQTPSEGQETDGESKGADMVPTAEQAATADALIALSVTKMEKALQDINDVTVLQIAVAKETRKTALEALNGRIKVLTGQEG